MAGIVAVHLAVVAPVVTLAADTIRPTVSVTAPAPGASLTGTVSLTVSASDNTGVTQVKWYVDGREVGWDGAAPWQVSWNSASVILGQHQIFAKAADAAGNWGTSATVSFSTGTAPPAATAPTGWQLVQSDDFNGTSLDTTKWQVYNSSGHAGNGLRHPSAVSVGNGVLTITARMVNGTLISGGMSNRFDQAYGRYEFRVRTDPDPTAATSGVVLTWPQSGRWPIDGENDIYETTLEPDRNPLKSFVHYGSDNRQYWFHHNIDGTQWHTFAMEWERTAIRIYRDGVHVWTLTDTNAIPDVAHHLSIQLDAFKKSMTGTVRLQVDWVRIYRR